MRSSIWNLFLTVGVRPPRVSRFPASPLVPRAKPALPPISPSPTPTTDEDGKFYDAEDGDACPEALAMYVQKTWKRPEQFMDDQPAVPMLLLKPPPPPPEDGEEPPVDENADPDDPSQPRPTGQPARRRSTTGAMPDDRIMLELGQWATPTPAAPSRATSPGSARSSCSSAPSR